MKLSLSEGSVDKVIEDALRVLKEGGVVSYPTESFYALGVAAFNESAVKRLFKLKRRSLEKALPLIVGSTDVLYSVVKSLPPQAVELMEKFWPGALTLVFYARDTMPGILLGDTNKVAVRIPGESFALRLARASYFPITATSANIAGEPPANNTDRLLSYFDDKIDLIIDGGKTPGGKPSTIVDVTVTPFHIIRQGSVLLETDR
jgi:L-threonylcarbamoyladenylate synthase